MKLKRILALAGVVVLVGLYVMTLVFAILGNGIFHKLFLASVAATIAIPIIIHLLFLLNNYKENRSPMSEVYKYKRKSDDTGRWEWLEKLCGSDDK